MHEDIDQNVDFESFCIIQGDKAYLDYSLLHPQSLPVSSANMKAESDVTSTEQLLQFADSAASEPLQFDTTLDDLQVDNSTNSDLGDFLKRPVLIKTMTWIEGFALNQTMSPWFEYFNNSFVKKKLDNYYLVKCNLHLKFVINASPFYYSAAMVSYRPLSGNGVVTSFEPCPVNGGLGLTAQELMGRSQRPRVFLYPQTSQGAEMVLPFFTPKNWLNATEADDLYGMGTINIDSLTALDNANSVVGQACTIQVYAWASNLEVAGPTSRLALQAKSDEYGIGVISQPASAIARYANYFTKIPVIGNFATATSLAATTAGKIAHLFGYTNVPVIADVHTFKAQQFPRLATTDIGTPIEKLTVDSKNELSIDNRLCGIDLGDELMISSIVTRESLLDTYFWNSTDGYDTLLWNSRVSPDFMVANTVASRNYIQGTPMWMVNKLFQYWRGDITFRFKFLCSQYHRGRVVISWDPVGAVDDYNETTNYSKIVDITAENDVEFTVPYIQDTSYLTCGVSTNSIYGTTNQTNIKGTSNGVLTVRVLTVQTSPVASAPIYISVFVKGASNLEFAAPKDLSTLTRTYSPYTVQSSETLYDTPVQTQLGLKPSQASSNINLIHMGETVMSLRQLLRRFNFSRNATIPSTAATNSLVMGTALMSRLPLQYGWDPDGINTATKTIGVGTAPFNFVQLTTMDWIGQCFVANKGSVHWLINIYDNAKSLREVVVSRPAIFRNATDYKSVLTVTTSNRDRISQEYRNFFHNYNSGASFANVADQSGISVSVPFYSKYKFASNNPLTRTDGTSLDDSNVETVRLQTIAYIENPDSQEDVRLDYFCAIGTDFNYIFFLNVPGLQENPGPSAA